MTCVRSARPHKTILRRTIFLPEIKITKEKYFYPKYIYFDTIGGHMNKGEDFITTLIGGFIMSISICTGAILIAYWIFS